MPFDFEGFKPAYQKWERESLPDYRAGNMKEIVKKYPYIAPDRMAHIKPPRTLLVKFELLAAITGGCVYSLAANGSIQQYIVSLMPHFFRQ